MKKLICFIFSICILVNYCIVPVSAAKKEVLLSEDEIKMLQTRIYNTNNIDEIQSAIIKTLEMQGYKNINFDEDLLYITADKILSVKDINKWLLVGYIAKTGLDVVQTLFTYGLKSYSVAGDILLIKTELKDKDVSIKTVVNIIPKGNKTIVRVSMISLMTGKRDGLFVGKHNRLKTVYIRDDAPYKIFFYRLNKELNLPPNLEKIVRSNI